MKHDHIENKTGPKPERVKITGKWEIAVKKALKKKRPDEGWPDEKPEKNKQES